ncbi:tRNA lysidine(34) synthetase TilS [Sphingomonas hylomeconis]|uniref:tRNA(Ile)-lysidine synthase n=1 Tax=Sphingomonas hylomeconis TaxID=1395958 RepID=A0ABV7SSK7_9SPHN|nr:tRNA lysidine(34) synthetase TilS [Sphingomonas hylomeconis]
MDAATALGRAVRPDDIIAIAVSGGPDSIALLALAARAWPGQVIAATVDHGLRAAAAAEAAMVAGFCATLGAGVPHATLRPATPLATANLQAAARAARYALLTDWAAQAGAAILLTAHHADDQAETFLMRAARGSGLAGLAGIRPRRPLSDTLTLLRPLLGWRCAELRALAEDWALPFVDDPSNASARYDRTQFRALLRQAPWLDAAAIARSAGYLAETDRELRAFEAWLLDTRRRPSAPGDCTIDMAGLPRELCRRLARGAIARVREDRAIIAPAWSDAANIEPLLDALAAGGRATQAGVMASARGETWHFTAAPPRRAG